MLRLLIGLPVAAAITAGLFYLMGHLIAPGDVPIDDGTPPLDLDLPQMRSEPEPQAARGRPETKLTPPPPVRPLPQSLGEPGPITAPPPAQPTLPTGPGPSVGPSGAIPIATMPPSYPPSCQSRATEGYAVVRYDVTFQGQVVNARVTDSSHRCFEQAALKAISAWRYQPTATRENGYLARGLTKRFTFTLS